MSTIVTAKELHNRDMIEMPNGSVYVVGNNTEGAPNARLWCAHGSDILTFDPQPIDLDPEQQVQVVSGEEVDTHRFHDGYVETVFRHEMDRRHVVNMGMAVEQQQRDAATQREHAHAVRPWWKKLAG